MPMQLWFNAGARLTSGVNSRLTAVNSPRRALHASAIQEAPSPQGGKGAAGGAIRPEYVCLYNKPYRENREGLGQGEALPKNPTLFGAVRAAHERLLIERS
jgi:hypothetical protein